MEAPLGHSRLSPEVWKEIFTRLPMLWRAMCCRVCKVWQKDLEQPHQEHDDDILVDYGLGTLCSVLATEGVDEVMRRIRLHYPSGIAADLGRMDQVRRFVQRYQDKQPESVDLWMQLASQEPDAGWLCKGASKTQLEGGGKSLMRQVVGKPQEFSKLLDTLNGHSERVTCVAYSPDGKHIASASSDWTVKVWDAETKQEVGIMRGHFGPVKCVAYSPDGKHIASGGSDTTVKIWDAVTMEVVGTLKGHSEFIPECICDFSLPVIRSNAECLMTGHSGRVNSVAYSPDGSQLASAGGLDNTVRLWDPKTMEHMGTLRGHSKDVTWAAYSPDGKRIASASNDQTVKVWDAVTMEEVCTLRGHSADNPECTCQHVDKEGYNRYKTNPECPVKGHSEAVRCVAYSPDGKHITSASFDRTVKIWDAVMMEEVCSLTGHKNFVTCVAYSPDGKRIASASYDYDKSVKIWDAETKQEVYSLKGPLARFNSVAFSPNSKFIVSGSDSRDNSVRIWDVSTEKEVFSLTGHTGVVLSLAYSPDGSKVASAGGYGDTTVRLWDPKTMEHKGTLMGHSGSVYTVAWSPDSEMIASGSQDCTIRLWSNSGKLKGTLKGHSDWVRWVVYSPDGQLIATASSDQTVKIWDALTMEEVCTLTGDWDEMNTLNNVAWSPDGEFIVSRSSDETIRFWSKSGKYIDTVRGHEAPSQFLHPETKVLVVEVKNVQPAGSKRIGQYIVTGAGGHWVHVYRSDSDGAKQGKPLACFRSPTTVTSMSCKGTSIVVGCTDGQVSRYLLCGANAAVFFSDCSAEFGWKSFGARVPLTKGHISRGVVAHVCCEHVVSLSMRMHA